MRVMNKLSLATVLGILAVSPSVYAADAPDISGSYKCSYHDPFTTPNDGTETVVFKKMEMFIKFQEFLQEVYFHIILVKA